jgi:beta-lactamase class A
VSLSGDPAERSNRLRAGRTPQHRRLEGGDRFAGSFTALGTLAYEGARVSATVLDLETGAELLSIDDRVVLPTAGLGTILLLIEVSARLTARDDSGFGLLDALPTSPAESGATGARELVRGAGLWRHLQAPVLPVVDVAVLVGALNDGVATNALLGHIPLDAVRERAESLGLTRTALLDRVRDSRGPDDAPQLSVGSTGELAALVAALARGEVVDRATSSRVVDWMALNPDLSLVASAFGLDPLSHGRADHDMHLVNRTGSDVGVRADAGAVRGPGGAVAYAVAVQFDDVDLSARLRALTAMRAVGLDIMDYLN